MDNPSSRLKPATIRLVAWRFNCTELKMFSTYVTFCYFLNSNSEFVHLLFYSQSVSRGTQRLQVVTPIICISVYMLTDMVQFCSASQDFDHAAMLLSQTHILVLPSHRFTWTYSETYKGWTDQWFSTCGMDTPGNTQRHFMGCVKTSYINENKTLEQLGPSTSYDPRTHEDSSPTELLECQKQA
jgi:hypothetical protein